MRLNTMMMSIDFIATQNETGPWPLLLVYIMRLTTQQRKRFVVDLVTKEMITKMLSNLDQEPQRLR